MAILAQSCQAWVVINVLCFSFWYLAFRGRRNFRRRKVAKTSVAEASRILRGHHNLSTQSIH